MRMRMFSDFLQSFFACCLFTDSAEQRVKEKYYLNIYSLHCIFCIYFKHIKAKQECTKYKVAT